jgi:hypothetical protein
MDYINWISSLLLKLSGRMLLKVLNGSKPWVINRRKLEKDG